MRKPDSRPRQMRWAAFLIVLWMLAAGSGHAGQSPPAVKIDLDQAIQLALAHNHALLAARTEILQSQAEEITAGIRPNPVLSADYTFVPAFTPSLFGIPTSKNPLPPEGDAYFSYTFERGGKRHARIVAARDQTTVTRSEVSDNERMLTFNVAQQFIGVLLAQSNLDFANMDLDSFQKTVDLSQDRYTAGAISEGDFLKIKLQLLQFQTDVSSAKLALVQARASLRQFLGYESVPENYAVAGDLVYAPLHLNKQDLELMALQHRPDLLAAKQSVTAANSEYRLQKANAKRDLTTQAGYSHVTGDNALDLAFNIELPFYDRNQGEIARTHYAIDQAQENETAAEQGVMTDVENAYEALHTADQVTELYQSGYLKQAQDSRDISEYAYKRGAASLLDFLDAERSYRATQLAYRQALADDMMALEQVRDSVGTRNLP